MNFPGPDNSEHTAQVQAQFVRHAADLRSFVVALLPDFGTADDVLQEVFLTVTAKAPEFTLGTNFLAWAKAIARFKIRAVQRSHWREKSGLTEETLESLCAAEPEPEAWPLELQLGALAECIEKLPPQTRRAVELRYKQAHPANEVARLLGTGPNALYVMLFRARAFLRDCVEEKLTCIST